LHVHHAKIQTNLKLIQLILNIRAHYKSQKKMHNKGLQKSLPDRVGGTQKLQATHGQQHSMASNLKNNIPKRVSLTSPVGESSSHSGSNTTIN
jgi:hypothetical protein